MDRKNKNKELINEANHKHLKKSKGILSEMAYTIFEDKNINLLWFITSFSQLV